MKAVIKQNDKQAKIIIAILSIVVFLVVVSLGKFKLLDVQLPFDRHIFAKINAIINSIVSVLLIIGLTQGKKKTFEAHKKTMLTAFAFSTLFLLTYICSHLFNADTPFGGVEFVKYIYYFILITHIVLAATILPFILFTVYSGLTAQFENHKKIARITFPIWLYVSITGVLVYLFIAPYYV